MSDRDAALEADAQWVADEAEAALAAARAFYQGEQLRLPPLPRELAARLFQWDEGEWGLSLEDPPAPDADEPGDNRHDLTDRAEFLDRATDPAAADDLAFGHVGHGLASWWMCYQLIRGPLALYIRLSYGSAYGDADAARRTINAAFRDAEALIVLADAAEASGSIGPDRRLVVAVDDRESPFWGLSDDPEKWQGSTDPIGAAETFLQG